MPGNDDLNSRLGNVEGQLSVLKPAIIGGFSIMSGIIVILLQKALS